MTQHDAKPGRRIAPRKWAMAALTGLAVVPQPALLSGAALGALAGAGRADQAAEAGEAGEAAVERSEDGPAAFLTGLGYFEGTYRIAAALYLGGQRDLARAHLDESHHAFYEDIEGQLDALHAPGFEAEAGAFLQAIAEDADDATVKARYDALMAAVGLAAQAAEASGYDRLLSIRELMLLAAAEYEGGVEADGQIGMAIEYRDSWGFYATARARAEALAAGDGALAEAGRAVLEQLDGLDALYPGLTASAASADPAQLTVAAGWIEIIALRQK
ncbi:MAG: hypothetical protein R3D85_09085 [Paracoccaceae bacterium]